MRAVAAALLVALVLSACSGGRTRAPEAPGRGWQERGIASWYGPGFHGRRTASGEVYDMHGISAAHKSLPFGSVVEVENLDNGRSVKVRINDRGPFVRGRVIDLSRGAAEKIGLVGPGTARVRLTLVGTAPAVVARDAREGREWVVQAGAFREARRAHALAERLRSVYPQV
ncbi:MAG: septal ring lytic transglycosylase RlpA family protein, partial [Thermoanaerobaculia bacterium]|nr:septal ring lytic transglycosylase RlpA family protein [Thermoanaerobaculia bacterium]